MFMEGVAQTCICRDTSCHSHMLDARLLHGQAKFLHEDVHNGVLQAGGQVFFMVLYEVGIVLYPFTKAVKEGRLQS